MAFKRVDDSPAIREYKYTGSPKIYRESQNIQGVPKNIVLYIEFVKILNLASLFIRRPKFYNELTNRKV